MRTDAAVMRAEALTGEQAAARRSVDRAFPAIAAFLASDDARPDADMARVDAPQVRAWSGVGHGQTAAAETAEVMRGHDTVMRPDAGQAAEPRTVAARLLDTPGATLTAQCPDWCVSGHQRDREHGTFAADFTHQGVEAALSLGDDEPLLSIRIEQRPFSAGDRTPVVATWPEAGPDGGELTPDGVYALAARLRAYADALDELGVDLDGARLTDRLERREAL